MEVSKTTLADASAAKTGGAIFAKDVPTVSLISSVIKDAKGSSGGCASIEGANLVSMSDCRIIKCDAKSGVGRKAAYIHIQGNECVQRDQSPSSASLQFFS